MEDWKFVMVLVTFFSGLVVQTLGVIKYMITRIDRGDEANRKQRSQQVSELHEKIAAVRKEYVRRDDFNPALNRLEKSMDHMHDEIRAHSKDVNGRIDNVLTAIANITQVNSPPGSGR